MTLLSFSQWSDADNEPVVVLAARRNTLFCICLCAIWFLCL